MASNEIVQDKNRSEALDHLQKCFQREYDLTQQADRMALVEAMTEFGKHAAMTCKSAKVSMTIGSNGLTALSLATTPTEVV